MEYVYNCSNLAAGTYRVLFSKMTGYTSCYSLYMTYDGVEHAISIPADASLSSTEWTAGNMITVRGSITKLRAVFGTNAAGYCIPAVQLQRVGQ